MTNRLPAIKPRDLIRVLEKRGFYIKRQTGSHAILVNEKLKKAIPVPFHNKDLKMGTLHGILKRAGIPPEDFKKLR